MNSQSNLKNTINSEIGRNNQRSNGTHSHGTSQTGILAQAFEFGSSIRKQKENPQEVQMYDGIELSVLNKISKISAKHRALLLETLGEFERNTRLNFTRIYPSPGSSYYDKFFETTRQNNKLVYMYLCQRTELWAIIEQSSFCDIEKTSYRVQKKESKQDVQVPSQGALQVTSQITTDVPSHVLEKFATIAHIDNDKE